MDVSIELTAGDFSRAGTASSRIKKILKQLNVPPDIIKRVVIALYESEVNVVAHSYGGNVTCTITSEGIDIVVQDQGPGIPDIDLAMSEGYSTASKEIREMGFGAGMGLPNIRKNVDALEINSSENSPTTISMHVKFTHTQEE